MYKVIAVIMDGMTINGFRLQDEEGKESNIKEDKFYELAKSSRVEGVTLLEDDGHEYLTGLKLRDLEVISGKSIKLESKLKDSKGNVIGYKLADRDKEISIKKAWNMGVNGDIQNGKSMLLVGRDGSITKYFQCDEDIQEQSLVVNNQ